MRNYGVCEQTNKSRSNSFGFGYQIAIVVQPLDLTQNIPTSLSSLARIYRAQGKLAEAEPLFKRALEIYEKKLGAEHPSVAATIGELAVLAFDREQFVEAEILKRRGLAIEEKKYGSENATVAYSQRWLARILLAQDKTAEAEKLMTTALAVIRKQPRNGDGSDALALTKLGNEHYEADRFFEAFDAYHRAGNLYEKAHGPDHEHVAACREYAARALKKLGRLKCAAVYEAEAAAIRARAK